MSKVTIGKGVVANVYRGPMATVYACPYCKHVIRVPGVREARLKGLEIGTYRRGYGMASSATARSELLRHVKAVHPEERRDAVASCG